VETLGLLRTNHFGASKQRSAEQALLLLQEHIYNARKSRKVLSLVSFDAKGVYNPEGHVGHGPAYQARQTRIRVEAWMALPAMFLLF
jgi:hypothetical protein